MKEGCRVGLNWPCPSNSSAGLRLSRVGSMDWEDRTSESSTWRQHGQELDGENVTPISELTLAPPERVDHRFRLGTASCPHCRSKLGRMRSLGLGQTDQESPPLGVALAGLLHRGELHSSPQLCNLARSSP